MNKVKPETISLNNDNIDQYLKLVGVSKKEVIAKPIDLDEVICPICITEVTCSDSKVTIRPCNHVFHEDCLDEWVEHNDTCPVCRDTIKNRRYSLCCIC